MTEYQPSLSDFVVLRHVFVFATYTVISLLATQHTDKPTYLCLNRVMGREELSRVLCLPFQAGLAEFQPMPLLVYVQGYHVRYPQYTNLDALAASLKSIGWSAPPYLFTRVASLGEETPYVGILPAAAHHLPALVSLRQFRF